MKLKDLKKMIEDRCEVFSDEIEIKFLNKQVDVNLIASHDEGEYSCLSLIIDNTNNQ